MLFDFADNAGDVAGACDEILREDLWVSRALKAESDRSIREALQTDAVARRILTKSQSPDDGELVGVRLNINVLKRTGVAVHSLHKATSKDGHTRGKGFYRGEVFAYLPVVTRMRGKPRHSCRGGKSACSASCTSVFGLM